MATGATEDMQGLLEKPSEMVRWGDTPQPVLLLPHTLPPCGEALSQ